MTKLKMRKRLTLLVLAFMLTFTMGAAFALTQGSLDIVGTVNLAAPHELYVIWSAVDATGQEPIPTYGGISGAAAGISGTQSAIIQNARGRTSQRIVWDVDLWDYVNGGGVIMIATALNQASVAADLTHVSTTWEQWNGTAWVALDAADLLSDWGLTLATTPTLAAFTATPLLPAETRNLNVALEWTGWDSAAGNLPDHHRRPALPDNATSEEEHYWPFETFPAVRFVLTIDYDAV